MQNLNRLPEGPDMEPLEIEPPPPSLGRRFVHGLMAFAGTLIGKLVIGIVAAMPVGGLFWNLVGHKTKPPVAPVATPAPHPAVKHTATKHTTSKKSTKKSAHHKKHHTKKKSKN